MKRALITGITGQDGSYLAEFLLAKGYQVFGLVRRTSTDPFERLDPTGVLARVTIVYGSLLDSASLQSALALAQPDEIYNLAAQSDVGISFVCPHETMETNYHGLGRLVWEATKQNPQVRIYQASTSEMFGATNPPQNEQSVFAPVSPYGESKLRAHQDYVVTYRTQRNLFICSGILFNHESPRRGKRFVTRKITDSLTKIFLGKQERLELGNLDAKRDWGFAGDYVEVMWQMLQQDTADDFVIATGESHTVRDFVVAAAKALDFPLTWEGSGLDEVAKDSKGIVRVSINPEFYRPTDVHYLLGDASKAKQVLGWEPKVDFQGLVSLMVAADLERNK